MVVGPSATPVEWRGVSVKVPRRPPTFGNSRSSRRYRHLGGPAGDERGKDHTNRRVALNRRVSCEHAYLLLGQRAKIASGK